MNPSYLNLYKSSELKNRAKAMKKILESCTLCPRNCKVNRLKGETGFCRSAYKPIVASYTAHFGEEPCLVGTGGSGTIFFGNCNLRCVYCQNFQISQAETAMRSSEVEISGLANIMLELKSRGCHNINLVSPSHFIAQTVEALILAIENGLDLPIVYNSNGYDSLETLELLDGIVDMYLPDIKYSSDAFAIRYSGAPDYVKANRAALKEMYRQVGDLVVDKEGIAQRGLIIRHLILPNDIAGSLESLQFIAKELSPNVTLSIMSQYYTTFKADEFPEINRFITKDEYDIVVAELERLNLNKGWMQDLSSPDTYRPDFGKKEPFERA